MVEVETDKTFMQHATMLTEKQKANATKQIQTKKGIAPRPDNMTRNVRMANTLDKFQGDKSADFNSKALHEIKDFK